MTELETLKHKIDQLEFTVRMQGDIISYLEKIIEWQDGRHTTIDKA